MDVLAMRKSSGEITGQICVNGHPQEEKSFRRCMGYVEQFDSQSPELTIRETCDFSAKLRLDEKDSAVTKESTRKFGDQTLAMLELTNIQDLQVGSDETGGLSFEQRKRLSIAVELVAVRVMRVEVEVTCFWRILTSCFGTTIGVCSLLLV
jgi:ABC-type multidrug transport system ATPase subunit